MENRKGYTMVELLVAFVIIAFILGIGVVSYRFIIDRIEANYYDTLEEELLLAGSDYFTNHREDKPLSGYSAIQIDELVGDKYIETLKDRKGNVCDRNDKSRVYIYKTSVGYGYEACLFCNEYEPDGAYCNNVAQGVINISASKEGGGSYNPLLSFANASWSNSDVTVTFSVNVPVTEFVITNTNNGETKVCDSIVNKSCSMKFSDTSTYKVQAYNESNEVAPEKGFNVKIDKTKPICKFISGPSISSIKNNQPASYVLKCTDNIGLSSNSAVSTSDFSLTTPDVVAFQEISSVSISDGYQYAITVSGNVSGTTALVLNYGAVSDLAGNVNDSVTSDAIEVDSDFFGPEKLVIIYRNSYTSLGSEGSSINIMKAEYTDQSGATQFGFVYCVEGGAGTVMMGNEYVRDYTSVYADTTTGEMYDDGIRYITTNGFWGNGIVTEGETTTAENINYAITQLAIWLYYYDISIETEVYDLEVNERRISSLAQEVRNNKYDSNDETYVYIINKANELCEKAKEVRKAQVACQKDSGKCSAFGDIDANVSSDLLQLSQDGNYYESSMIELEFNNITRASVSVSDSRFSIVSEDGDVVTSVEAGDKIKIRCSSEKVTTSGSVNIDFVATYNERAPFQYYGGTYVYNGLTLDKQRILFSANYNTITVQESLTFIY